MVGDSHSRLFEWILFLITLYYHTIYIYIETKANAIYSFSRLLLLSLNGSLLLNYRLQHSCSKVMLHQSVILSTGRCLADTPTAGTPWADTRPLGRHPLGRHPSGQTPQADTPWADTPLPQGRPLQRTVRILLECILVFDRVADLEL